MKAGTKVGQTQCMLVVTSLWLIFIVIESTLFAKSITEAEECESTNSFGARMKTLRDNRTSKNKRNPSRKRKLEVEVPPSPPVKTRSQTAMPVAAAATQYRVKYFLKKSATQK